MASIVEFPFDESDALHPGEVQDIFADFKTKQPYNFSWAENIEGQGPLVVLSMVTVLTDL